MIGDVVTVRTAMPGRENRRCVTIADAQIAEVIRQLCRPLESKLRIELQAVCGGRDTGLNCHCLILQSLLLTFIGSFETSGPVLYRPKSQLQAACRDCPRLLDDVILWIYDIHDCRENLRAVSAVLRVWQSGTS